MLRNIHFFNIKPGVDRDRMLSLLDHDLAEYARSFGCLERKTYRLLDARSQGQSTDAAEYMNESLWPSQKEADAFSRADAPGDVKAALEELRNGIQLEKTVRYVDEEG